MFGWLKAVGMLRKTRHRRVLKVGWGFTFAPPLTAWCLCGICWPVQLVPHEAQEKCVPTRRRTVMAQPLMRLLALVGALAYMADPPSPE